MERLQLRHEIDADDFVGVRAGKDFEFCERGVFVASGRLEVREDDSLPRSDGLPGGSDGCAPFVDFEFPHGVFTAGLVKVAHGADVGNAGGIVRGYGPDSSFAKIGTDIARLQIRQVGEAKMSPGKSWVLPRHELEDIDGFFTLGRYLSESKRAGFVKSSRTGHFPYA